MNKQPDKDYIAKLRVAKEAGKSTLKVTAAHLSKSELAAALRRVSRGEGDQHE